MESEKSFKLIDVTCRFLHEKAYIRIWDIQTYPKVASENLVDWLVQGGPLPVISKVKTPISRVITPVTHLEGHL